MGYQVSRIPINGYEARRYAENISCDWNVFREQLLEQWDRLSAYDLENTGHNRWKLAELIHTKYGISSKMAENYLRNFEQKLPGITNAHAQILDFKR